LYTYLVIGILSFSACSSVISNGFSRLIKLRPDGDTLCAFAHVTAIVALIPYLSLEEYIQRGMSHVYLVVSLAALCFNTISKLFTVWSAKRNFKFTSGDSAKFFVERSDSESAEQLARGSVSGMPVVTSMRKTELLCDFIISTYCEDVSDRIARIVTPITCAAAVAAGVGAYFMVDSVYVMNHISWASTVASAIFSIGATFTGSLIVASPMLTASKKLTASNAAVLGYNAVDEISETNAVLIEAKTLFPANSVVINNIWDYNKHRKGNSPKVPIDEAIIYAASLAIASDSILSDAFFNMLNYKQPLLKSVSNCVYESNLGVMGWIDRRRVLLGNREHMKSHGIVVPDMKKESAANKNGDEVIYLAVGGEVCMLFFVELFANTQVKENVIKLAKHGVSLVIKTVDGMITQSVISELFDISSEKVKIIPFEAHEDFNEHTKFVPKGSAAASCDGTFTSFAAVVNGAKNLKEKITFGCTMQITGIALGMLLAIIFMLFENYGMFNCLYLLLYNVAWVALTAIVQAFKRI
jgi:Cu+-exporting ATPase